MSIYEQNNAGIKLNNNVSNYYKIKNGVLKIKSKFEKLELHFVINDVK